MATGFALIGSAIASAVVGTTLLHTQPRRLIRSPNSMQMSTAEHSRAILELQRARTTHIVSAIKSKEQDVDADA